MIKTDTKNAYTVRGQLSAPVGLDLETIAEQALQDRGVCRGLDECMQLTDCAESEAAESVEESVRDSTVAGQSEQEVASLLNRVADTVESKGYKKLAFALKLRAIRLVAKTLNQMNGIDR